MDDVAFVISEDLKLDVTGMLDESFQQQAVVTKSRSRFAARGLQSGTKLSGAANHLHPLPATATGWFDHERKADLFGFAAKCLVRLIIAVLAGNHRDSGGGHDSARFGLGSHPLDRFGGRSDKNKACLLARCRKGRSLG